MEGSVSWLFNWFDGMEFLICHGSPVIRLPGLRCLIGYRYTPTGVEL